jgi:eukaryotic-like serine/threonine-protein kinase
VRLAGRVGAGALGGGLVLAALEALGPEPPFSAPAAAGLAALAIALLPRIGWLLAAAGVCVWLASPEADRQGTALVVAVAVAPVPFLLPRAGLLWSLPVLAPLLGTIALAPAFVGVAALAPTAWRRAGLAAAGFLWLVLGEALSGEALLFGAPDGTLPRGNWEGSLTSAASDVLEPLLTTPASAPLVVWAAFAALLPLAVRGRWIALDLIGAGLWTAGLIAAQVALGDVLAADVALDQARGAVAGAIVAALVVVSVSRIAPPAEAVRAPRITTV